MSIKGITTSMVDKNTGAMALFHRIGMLQCDLRNNSAMVVVNSYVDESKFDNKRTPIFSTTFNYQEVIPEDQDPRDWAYGKLTASVPEGANAADPKYQFAGAPLVRP